MVLIRKCLIGSIIFHLVALGWAGLCRSRPVLDRSPGFYLQIYSEPEAKPQASSGPGRQVTARCLSKTDSLVISAAPPPKSSQPKQAEPSQRTAIIAKEIANVANGTVALIPVNTRPASLSQGRELTTAAAEKVRVKVSAGPSLPPQASDKIVNKIVASGRVTPNQKEDVSNVGESVDRIAGLTGHNGNTNVDLVETDLTDVDVHSVKINCPEPNYPPKAKKFNWEGIVILEGEVKTNGRMGKVKVVKSSGYDILDQEARLTVKCWRYQPAMKDGKPISCQRRIPIIFNLED